MKTYHVQVNTYGDPDGIFTGNAKVYATEAEAIEFKTLYRGKVYATETEAVDAAKDLFSRWTAVETWRVIDSDNNVIETGP